jgi:Pyruvate/2-oxoacid:ferredoxin oxidoreductase delta subunit
MTVKEEKKYLKAVKMINNAEASPIPLLDENYKVFSTLTAILKHLLTEDEIDFIFSFKRKTSQTMEELKASSGLSEEEILEKVNGLTKKSVIFNQPNRHGVMVYKLLSFVRIFENTFMKDVEPSNYIKKLAFLFVQVFGELSDFYQEHYNFISSMIQNTPPILRIYPILKSNKDNKEIQIEINEEIEVPKEKVLQFKNVEEIIEKSDDIAIGNCYCRHHKVLLDDSCKINAPLKSCFTFGKTARFTSQQGFANKVSKDEALKILKKTENYGLVHKSFHHSFDINKDIVAVCNCCKCCCVISGKDLIVPHVDSTNYLAKINYDLCKGLGICAEKCINEAIRLNDDKKPVVTKDKCIGCGVCASFCPEGAISLLKGTRNVLNLPQLRDRDTNIKT